MADLDDIPLAWELAALVLLLAMSGFFSIAETSMMALNRYRLRHMVAQGHGGARRAAELLRHTDRLLGAILIGNNVVNAAAATLASVIALELVGQGRLAYAVSTLGISFVIIVFAEVTPKVIGATYPERIALPLAYVLGPLQRLLTPAIWFVNLFSRPLLQLAGVRPGEGSEAPRLSPEEIRTLVRESSAFMPKKHVTILLNLFDLTDITVQDIMLPRARIESLKLDDDMATLARHLATSYHMRLPVFRDSRGDVLGVLHLRKVLSPLMAGTLDKAQIEALLAPPYFVPATTPVFAQMQYFQENEERIALVVDEYGELMGLVTLEEILEEIIGEFTTHSPLQTGGFVAQPDGSYLAEGATPLRELNRKLGFNFPLDGPKTLNGLILEHFQDIPEPNTSARIAGYTLEIVQTQDRVVRAVRVFPPGPGTDAGRT